MGDDAIRRLKNSHLYYDLGWMMEEDIETVLGHIAALEAERERLREALRPFVRLWTETLVHFEGVPADMRSIPASYLERAHQAFPELDDNDD